jgi:hypothetical protein
MIDYTTSPEHTFLHATEVFNRYRWGRTKGYQQLARPTFPKAIEGRYRLELLHTWEARTGQISDTDGLVRRDDKDLAMHTFLTAKEVIARYRWGRTKGYAVLRSEDFPCGIARVFRLDTLMAWEELQLQGPDTSQEEIQPKATAAAASLMDVVIDRPDNHTTELPRRRRTRGIKKKENN